MQFDSYVFAVFLPLVLAGYYALSPRPQVAFLLAASYVFYGWWDWRFLSLLAISTVVDYTVGLSLRQSQDERRRRLLLLLSVATNLGILGFFKYFNFFVDSAAALLEGVGMRANVPTLRIILPVGISFYTFQTMSYTIDIYRRRMEPTRDFLAFALYVSFFPQLVAGPIERASRLLPQLLEPRVVTPAMFRSGSLLILIGLFRKIGIADAVAPMVDKTFFAPEALSSPELLAGLYLFSLQIYCDFAGYSDIARGCARLLGVELMENFNQPYLATNISDFWRRWHISLSTWLRDYLYIPLGGNRYGEVKTYRNLMLTMLLGGLWHGAAWTFVVWGGLHGLYLAARRYWVGEKPPSRFTDAKTIGEWSGALVKLFFTLHLVVFAWLFFRAPDFSNAWQYVKALAPNDLAGLNWSNIVATSIFPVALYGVGTLALDVVQARREDHTAILKWRWPLRGLAYGCLLVWILSLGGIDTDVPFIYFQF